LNFHRPRHLSLTLGFIIAIGPVSVDMYLPAFSMISDQFGASAPQYSLAAYFLGFAAGQLAQGPFADRAGRRTPLAVGLVIYVAGSIGCAFAFDTYSLCIFRALAAFGGAASIVVPRAMVRDLADGAQAAKLMSQVLQVMSIAPVIAPMLGGVVLFIAGWRSIFIVAACYGIAGLALTIWYLPETLPPERRLRIRYVNVLRIYGTILRDRGFLSHAMIGTFGMCALFAYLAGTPAVVMGEYGYSPFSYAALLALSSSSTIGFFRLNGFLVMRWNVRHLIGRAVIVMLAATAMLTLFAWFPAAGPIPIFLSLFIFIFGYCGIPSNSQIGALEAHQDHAATATGLMSTMQYCGGAVAGQLVGLFSDGTARPMASIMCIAAIGACVAASLRPASILQGSSGKHW
jgi:DHA1 family bicyclomycin/chloramphenicol resistance-like MFS transporter